MNAFWGDGIAGHMYGAKKQTMACSGWVGIHWFRIAWAMFYLHDEKSQPWQHCCSWLKLIHFAKSAVLISQTKFWALVGWKLEEARAEIDGCSLIPGVPFFCDFHKMSDIETTCHWVRAASSLGSILLALDVPANSAQPPQLSGPLFPAHKS